MADDAKPTTPPGANPATLRDPAGTVGDVPATAQPAPAPVERLGRYELGGEVGRGGMVRDSLLQYARSRTGPHFGPPVSE